MREEMERAGQSSEPETIPAPKGKKKRNTLEESSGNSPSRSKKGRRIGQLGKDSVEGGLEKGEDTGEGVCPAPRITRSLARC
jgi:hypothetical protein